MKPLMDPRHIAELDFDPGRRLARPHPAPVVEQLSRDFYWYSPVLRKQLDGKVAEVVVQPLNADRNSKRAALLLRTRIFPSPLRGAGTGNYGQAVPLQGGVVLDLTRMDQIEAIQPDGVAVCQPGVRLGVLENEARKAGWELRCYPSTIVKASLGGFLGGGSGGIGSVANGNLRDFETVRALEVVTMEAGASRRPSRRARPSTKFCTPGAPTASSRASGWRSRPRSNGRSARSPSTPSTPPSISASTSPTAPTGPSAWSPPSSGPSPLSSRR